RHLRRQHFPGPWQVERAMRHQESLRKLTTSQQTYANSRSSSRCISFCDSTISETSGCLRASYSSGRSHTPAGFVRYAQRCRRARSVSRAFTFPAPGSAEPPMSAERGLRLILFRTASIRWRWGESEQTGSVAAASPVTRKAWQRQPPKSWVRRSQVRHGSGIQSSPRNRRNDEDSSQIQRFRGEDRSEEHTSELQSR